MADLPTFQEYLNAAQLPAAAQPAQTPEASGTGNWLTSGLQSGFYNALGSVGSAVQAGATALGADDTAQSAADYAARQRATAATYARSDLEKHPWSIPGMGYQIAQGLPGFAAILGGAGAAAIGAPEEAAAGAGALATAGARRLLGAGLAAYPLSVGENVQRQEDYSGDLSQGDAAKALALGVPEAAAQTILPHQLEGAFARGIGGNLVDRIVHGAATGAAIQGGTGALTEFLTQQMGDPNRTFADKAQSIVQSALSGAFQGGVFGGGLGALAKTPPQQLLNDPTQLSTTVDDVLSGKPQPIIPTGSTPPTEQAPQGTLNLGDNPAAGAANLVSKYPTPHLMDMYEQFKDARMGGALPDGDVLLHDAIGQELLKRAEAANTTTQGTLPLEAPQDIAQPALPLQGGFAQGQLFNQPGGEAPGFTFGEPPVAPEVLQNRLAQVAADIQSRQDELSRVAPVEQAPVKLDQTNPTEAPTSPEPAFDFAGISKKLPASLKNQDIKSMDQLKDALAQHILEKDQADKTPAKPVVDLATKLGVLDDKGQLTQVPKAPEAPPTPEPTVSQAPAKDLLTTDRQKAAYDAIEKVRALGQKIGDDPDTMGLMAQADKLHTDLQKPGRGQSSIQAIEARTRALQKVMEGRITESTLAPVAQEDTSVPATVDQPSPVATNFIAETKAAEAAKPAKKVAPPKNQAEAVAQKAAKLAPKVLPDLSSVNDALTAAKASLSDVMDKSRVVHQDNDMESPAFQKVLKSRLGSDERAGREPQTPEAHFADYRRPIDKRANDMNAALNEQNAKLTNIGRMLKSGDMEGLSRIKDTYFQNPKLEDNVYDTLDKKSRALMDAHYEAEQKVLDAVHSVAGAGPVPLLAADDRPITQHDINLKNVIHQTNDTRNGAAVLDYIRKNDPNPANRELAYILSNQGINPRVRLAGPGDPIYDALREKFPNDRIAASYSSATDRVGIHVGDDMSSSVLHEMTHAATLKAINANTPAARDMQKLYDYVKGTSPDQDHYGLSNVKEFVTEAFTNPTFQKFLAGMDTPVGMRVGSVWKAFKNAVFRMIGGIPRMATMFDSVMDTAHDLMNENRGLQSADNTPVARVDRGMREVAKGADAIGRRSLDAVRAEASGLGLNIRSALRKQILGWVGNNHIAEVWGKLVPALKSMTGLQELDSTRSNVLSRPSVAARLEMKGFGHKVAEQAESLMARTVQNLNPWDSWEKQPWLHGSKNADVMKGEVAQANKDWAEFNKTKGAAEAFMKLKASNDGDYFRHQVQLARTMLQTHFNDGIWPGFSADPFAEFSDVKNAALHDDPFKANEFWQQKAFDQMTGLKTLRDQITVGKNEVQEKLDLDRKQKDPAQRLSDDARQNLLNQRSTLSRNYESVKSIIDDFTKANQRSSQGVYFHLGREGTHFVQGHIAVDPTGEVNAENADKLRQALEAGGIKDAAIMRGAENTNVYIRLRNPDQMERAFEIFKKAQDAGVLAQDKPISRGEAGTTDIYKSISPVWMTRLIDAVRETKPDIPEGLNPAEAAKFEAAHKQQMRDLTRQMLNMTPENSLSRIYAHRENVQGFSKNMLDNFEKSALANARGTSRMSLAQQMAQSAREMKEQVRANNENRGLTSNQVLGGAQAAAEILLREKQRETHVPSTFMDGIRQMTHSFQIGSSPSYFFTLMTQIPTLSHPELAKTHGYANSALALARAAPLTFKAMRAIMRGPDALRFGMREDTLMKAGISKEDADFLMYHEIEGDFNHAAYSQAIGGHGPLSHGIAGNITRPANALGLYSEMLPRLITALAARDLYNQRAVKLNGKYNDMHSFVSHVVKESQQNWAPSNAARQLTRSGMFGSMSPLINQFMNFQVKLTEKLYREVHAATAGDSPEEKAQSRKWLLAHAGAVTMFAGTLGLPMLSTAAAVYDRLKDWATGEDDNDVQASYRSFLASAFGKGTGEVIARGLPRAFGADFDHVGEGRIMPGSTFLNALVEKRSMEDAEKDWLKSEAGSSVGFLMNIAGAGRDFLNGDYMNGLIKMAPEALKAPTEAWRIANRGFVDKNGTRLPITASAFDVAMKAIGIDPAKEAEYDEVKRVETGLNTMRQLRAKNITQHLLLAVNRGDTANMNSWLQASQEFGREHPGIMPPAAMLGRDIAKTQRAAAIARGLGMPIGENVRDIATRGMVGFGNFRN